MYVDIKHVVSNQTWGSWNSIAHMYVYTYTLYIIILYIEKSNSNFNYRFKNLPESFCRCPLRYDNLSHRMRGIIATAAWHSNLKTQQKRWVQPPWEALAFCGTNPCWIFINKYVCVCVFFPMVFDSNQNKKNTSCFFPFQGVYSVTFWIHYDSRLFKPWISRWDRWDLLLPTIYEPTIYLKKYD